MSDKTKLKTTTAVVTPEKVTISPPNFQYATVTISGTAAVVMNKMSSVNRNKIITKQMAGSQSNKGAKREPKDFDSIYRGAMHISEEGWYGLPSAGLRTAMVRACSLVGFKMTLAKLSLFVEHDGVDADEGSPLIRMTSGTPVRKDMVVKLADGSSDVLARPYFAPPWSADVRLKWDGDQFSATDVINLLARVGGQVGICAGRPGSSNSCGMGWETFQVTS